MRNRVTICTQICDCRAGSLNNCCNLPLSGSESKENRKALHPLHCPSTPVPWGRVITPLVILQTLQRGLPIGEVNPGLLGEENEGCWMDGADSPDPWKWWSHVCGQFVCMAVYLHMRASQTSGRLVHVKQTGRLLPMSQKPSLASPPRSKSPHTKKALEGMGKCWSPILLHFVNRALETQKGGSYLRVINSCFFPMKF